MKKMFKIDSEFNHNVKNYNKKDGFLAMVLFLIFILFYILLAELYLNIDIIKDNIQIVGCVINIVLIMITLLFIKMNHQNLDSIGILKGNYKISIIIGVILVFILFYTNCISNLINGYYLVSLDKVYVLIIYYFLVFLCEEIVFRGYIGTRIYGLVKNKVMAIVLVGILFILMHFPYRMIVFNMTFQDLTINNIGWILDLFITHLVLSIIYMKTNSLYGAIIPHWISNLAYNIVNR